VLGGLQIWGPLGLVLGPVMIAITIALLEIFRRMEPDSTGEQDL
jgi:predicted PurR-regulated permease PerM